MTIHELVQHPTSQILYRLDGMRHCESPYFKFKGDSQCWEPERGDGKVAMSNRSIEQGTPPLAVLAHEALGPGSYVSTPGYFYNPTTTSLREYAVEPVRPRNNAVYTFLVPTPYGYTEGDILPGWNIEVAVKTPDGAGDAYATFSGLPESKHDGFSAIETMLKGYQTLYPIGADSRPWVDDGYCVESGWVQEEQFNGLDACPSLLELRAGWRYFLAVGMYCGNDKNERPCLYDLYIHLNRP